MWTNGIDDKWYTDSEFIDAMFEKVKTDCIIADVFGEWVNDEFTAWDAFEFAVLAHVNGEDPLRSMYKMWMTVTMKTDRLYLERLFGYNWWPGEGDDE